MCTAAKQQNQPPPSVQLFFCCTAEELMNAMPCRKMNGEGWHGLGMQQPANQILQQAGGRTSSTVAAQSHISTQQYARQLPSQKASQTYGCLCNNFAMPSLLSCFATTLHALSTHARQPRVQPHHAPNAAARCSTAYASLLRSQCACSDPA